jgi:MoaA/NifB/PqqE/SkfB family radical SAM enzyme
MCFVYPLDQREKIKSSKEPTFDELKYCIDESCKLGAQVIVPFGGEPLIRKDIGDILRYIKEKKRYCILYTNGTFVKNKIDDLKLVDQLVISIDGDEETNDSIRGKGAYKDAVEALELAVSKGIVCRIHACLIPDTKHSLPHMCELSRKYNVMLNYGYCDTTGLRKPAEESISLGREEVIKFLKSYYEMKKSGVKISSPAQVIKECIRIMENWPSENYILSREEEKKYRHLKIPKCALPFSNAYIDTDGSVYPCLPLWNKTENTPNIYRDGFKKAWDAYKDLDCHQCASVFTIEKAYFYNFNPSTLIQYLLGYEVLHFHSD